MQDNKQEGNIQENQGEPAINKEENNKEVVLQAHEQADKDMEEDAEFTASSPNDDLDEEESARLGENTDLI